MGPTLLLSLIGLLIGTALATALRTLRSLLQVLYPDTPILDCFIDQLLAYTAAERGTRPTTAEGPFPPADHPDRVRVVESGGRQFLALGDDEVVVLGGNYVLKAAPWFPPAADVEADCELVVKNLEHAGWSLPGKKVVPCWRLGCLWSGAMPTPGKLDPAWVERLRETVEVCRKYGIYVFLEVHQDAMCSTNGGEGIPWWVANEFQKTPEYPTASYLVSPSHPLELALPWLLKWLVRPFFCVQTVPGDDDPWRAFSVEDDKKRDPELMNVGNPSIRLNNYGASWRAGTLFVSKQVQSLASRLYRSFAGPHAAVVFDGYATFVKLLAEVWRDFPNVIAIETLNEPPMGGLNELFAGYPRHLLRMRSDLWRFQAAALDALDAAGMDGVVVAVTDVGQALPGFSPATTMMATVDPLPTEVAATMRRWADAKRLMLSFHYYAPPTMCSFESAVFRAQLFGVALGGPTGVPTFLSEFVQADAADVAADMVLAVEMGTSAVAYWQFVSDKASHFLEVGGKPITFYKQLDGWAAYPAPIKPPAPKEDGSLPKFAVTDDLEEFKVYQAQLERGEFWGAAITQFGGAEVKHAVLDRLNRFRRPRTVLKLKETGAVMLQISKVMQKLAEKRRKEAVAAAARARRKRLARLLGMLGVGASEAAVRQADGEKKEL